MQYIQYFAKYTGCNHQFLILLRTVVVTVVVVFILKMKKKKGKNLVL